MTNLHSIDDLLALMVERDASDLHLTAGSPPVIRVNGRLERLADHAKLTPEEIRTLMYRILSTEQQKILETRRQIDLSHSIPGLARFRVNTYFQRTSVGAAFRLIPARIKSLEELGIPTRLYELADKPRGLVLVTGPTGSGKSTTLASLIDRINSTRHEHILTIEDPIEFLHHHRSCIVNQREIGEDATSFSEGLRAALRQDPDVILVGEMRDLETISTALTAAETGHLVFATLHTQSAPQTIDRVIDVVPGRAAGPGARAARSDAAGRRDAEPRPDRRRPRPHRGARDPHARRRRPEPDPSGEDRADLLGHADELLARNADDGAVAGRPGAART